jgi:hypothetical protein
MISSKERQMLLLICLCVYVAPLSCKPRATERSPKESKGESVDGQVGVGSEGLSKEQVMDAAKRVALHHRMNPDSCDIVYDEGNRLWRDAFPKLLPDLDGHDYQAVRFRRRHSRPIPSEPLWVLIDRKNGEVLKIIIGERGL